MSHELRTPLNSLLILSDHLCKNPDGNLSTRQIEYSRTIHSSGNDLLMLINDILDLSKIESGTVVLDVAEHRLADMTTYVERTFRHVAEARHVEFVIHLGDGVPVSIVTDLKRLQQILKNLLSNAFKFTHHGHVSLTIEHARGGWSEDNQALNSAGSVIAFSVQDTGIGISADKQQIVFEAFQQADGSTSRKYGGTGLGLAISRELSKLLGGEIRLTSTPNEGSTFTLFLPRTNDLGRSGRRKLMRREEGREPVPGGSPRASFAVVDLAAQSEMTIEVAHEVSAAHLIDDRDNIVQGDRVALIVENDPAFAGVMVEAARQRGFKALTTAFGAYALTLTDQFKPDLITLDLFLPDMDGWQVLARLKNDMATRHIPVWVISTDESRDRALRSGALAFLSKPVESQAILDNALAALARYIEAERRVVLVALSSPNERELLSSALQALPAAVVSASSREELLKQLSSPAIDALVLADDIAGISPEDIEAAVASREALSPLPVIVSAAGPVPPARWQRVRDGFVALQAASPDQLLDLSVAALHIDAKRLGQEHCAMLQALRASQNALKGVKALIVDDDMRNIFALATIMEDLGMRQVWADNGRDAIRQVESDPEIQIVMMDIMMPEMDGLATMREIRKRPVGKALPIIAVTAKAMKGDREKCIEAGAWDYLSKPVNRDDLLAVLHAWLHR
jgi:CheY-like chemotaxis protein